MDESPKDQSLPLADRIIVLSSTVGLGSVSLLRVIYEAGKYFEWLKPAKHFINTYLHPVIGNVTAHGLTFAFGGSVGYTLTYRRTRNELLSIAAGTASAIGLDGALEHPEYLYELFKIKALSLSGIVSHYPQFDEMVDFKSDMVRGLWIGVPLLLFYTGRYAYHTYQERQHAISQDQ